MATTKTAPKKKAAKVIKPRAKAAPKAKAPRPAKTDGLTAPIYNAKGASAGSIALPAEIFGLQWNADLVHQVVVSMQANARRMVAHTKDRSEVRGGGRKPWKQKGTGRARHGSSRSPIWVGGGVTHGPRADKSYVKKINRSMRRKALLVTLSRKYRDGEVAFVSDLGLATPKAAEAKNILNSLTKVKGLERLMYKKVNGALIATLGREPAVIKSFGNFRNVTVEDALNLNPVSILASKYLIIVSPEKTVEALMKRMTAN
jgi:large subunit ribosomal protein L4